MCNRRKVRVRVREIDYLDLLKKFNINLDPSHTKECVIDVPDNEDSYKYLSTKEGILDWKFIRNSENKVFHSSTKIIERDDDEVDILVEEYKESPDTKDLLKLLKGIFKVRLISPGFLLTPHNLKYVMIPEAILSHIDEAEDKKYLSYLKNLITEQPYLDLIDLLKSTWNINNRCSNFNEFFYTVLNIK